MGQKNTSKVAVITGATGGIGAAIAKSLSGAGYLLVLNAPSSEKLGALASELGGPCVVLPETFAPNRRLKPCWLRR